MQRSSFAATPASPALLWAVAFLSLAAVGVAVFAQYRYDMRPCPWCILQRAIYVVIALLCTVAALWRSRAPRAVLGVAALVFCVLGIVSAIYQHEVAAKMFSCNLTFADRVITALRLESLLPSVFGVTASCADAAVSVAGVPFEYWSLSLYAVMGAMLTVFILQRRGR